MSATELMALLAYAAMFLVCVAMLRHFGLPWPPPSLSELREGLRQMPDALRALPGFLSDRVDHWLMDMHQPTWTDEPQPAPCRHCRKAEWPCETYMDAAGRYADRGKSLT